MSADAKPSLMTVAPILVAALTVIVGVWQYVQTRQLEFHKRYWEEQVAWYAQATEAAASIATAATFDETREARGAFWRLYWGKLSLIESREVEQAMVAFGKELSRCERAPDTCFAQPSASNEATPLRKLSYELAHCAAYSLSTTWNPTNKQLDPASRSCPHVAP
jgi:hypothetical protein